ncbi:hypothetical protein [Butyrivibrio sp. MC2021]|uniref:hypothetical protein n=1 Tax=Butyrivibrio sp. MC2021 TaxID=1408306 RepID=UPI00047EF296|nr:hypothetical protein [Butyrivibrio sp. MC2021]
MSIAALALDRYTDNTATVAGKENYVGVEETSKSFGAHLNEATEKKCPYSFLAKDGIINYKGVVFECDYQQNAITLGNMYEKEKVLKIYLPSGGALHVNVDNINQLSKAASMFTPEDLKAFMRALQEYNHCTRKRHEIEEEKSKPIEETAQENETPHVEKEPELQENSLIEQINSYKTELYLKLLNNETEVKIRIGSQEFSDKEWDKLMERVDQEQERIQEALDEKEEKQAEEFMQARNWIQTDDSGS